MAFQRHSSRHIHAALTDRVTAGLDTLGWLGPNAVPFGATPVKIKDTRPFVGERMASSIEVGDVVISGTDVDASQLEEMGGPLATMRLPFFVDVFTDTIAEATALTDDIRDLFCGRVEGFGRFVPYVNKATDEVVPEWKLELVDVEKVQPEHNFPAEWMSVHVTVEATFSEVVW